MNRLHQRARLPRAALVALFVLIALSPLTTPFVLAAERCQAPKARPQAGKASQERTVIPISIQLREGPGLKCDSLGAIPMGVTVEVTGSAVKRDNLDWVRVSSAFGAGFVWEGGLSAPGEVVPTQIPVLMYHRIDNPPGPFEVSSWTLDAHLAWLVANGYTSVTPRDLLAAIDNGVPLPPKPVILSIDDGYLSSLGFAQALAAYGFEGTYFLPNQASWRLTDAEMAWLADVGEVCGHTVDHADLALLSWDEQWRQIAENKTWLEQLTGETISCFSYPFGSYNAFTADVVAAAGYTIAFNAFGGSQPLDGTFNRWHVLRIDASFYPTPGELAAAIGA